MTGLVLPQPGILALGTSAHSYLELDLVSPAPAPADLLAAVALISGGLMTGQGCNVVVGFRPGLWRRLVPGSVPDGVHGFAEPLDRSGRVHDAGHPARPAGLGLGRHPRRGLRRGDARGPCPRRPGVGRRGDHRMDLSPPPRPHRLRRRHREPADGSRGVVRRRAERPGCRWLGPPAPAVGPRRPCLGEARHRRSGAGHGAHQGRQRGDRRQEPDVPHRPQRPGRGRPDPAAQHRLRRPRPPRHPVRRAVRRPGRPARDAAPDGRCRRRRPRRPHPLHHTRDRRLLLPAGRERPAGAPRGPRDADGS